MWNTLQRLSGHPVVRCLKKLLGDPVQLYCIFLVMTVMQYYQEDENWLYTIISVFLSFALMKFYDFVAAHKWLGPLCYVVFAAVGLFAVSMIVDYGSMQYPISFLVWFLTPRSVVDFSLWYTIAMYLLMIGFLSGTVYYFSKIRYRMLMQLIIMMIPLSLYAKEGKQMPAILVILLLASFFLLMVYCRQIRYAGDVRYLPGMRSGMSIAAYVLSFSILAAVVPKPHITADRYFIENAMAYSSISDVLMNTISMFTSVSNGGNAGSTSDRVLYEARSASSLRLRTQTYSWYKGDDTWNASDPYDYPDSDYEDMFLYSPRDLLQAICDAAAVSEEFAAEYGIEDLAGMTLPELSPSEFWITPRFQPSYLLPSPTRLHDLEERWKEPNFSSRQNTLSLSASRTYPRGMEISMTYYPDTYARNYEVASLLRRFSNDTFRDLLWNAEWVLRGEDEDAVALLAQCYYEDCDARLYLQESRIYDWHSDAIDQLAQEITAGLDSDYEKALAIERYFTEQGFVYDLSYQKSPGDNAETFLFSSKRGVCYEFATAMVLLCRSAGLPARYTEGYNMNRMEQQLSPYSRYSIRVRDSHAFPEVYISGYGWLSFEPTVAANVEEEHTAENHYVMLWGLCLLGIAGLVLLGLYLAPRVREGIFRRRLAGLPPRKAASAVFCRMRMLLKLPDSTAVSQLIAHSAPFCPWVFLMDLSAQLDTLLYAPEDTDGAPSFLPIYTAWYDAWKAYGKEQRQQHRKHRKDHKNELV